MKAVENKFAGKSYNEFKEELAQVIIEGLAPFQKKYAEIDKDKSYVLEVINSGAKKARELAEPMMKEIRQKIGLSQA